MKIYKIWNDSPSDRQIDEICQELEQGNVIIWPTDTLYGLACDALNQKAVERVCKLKRINPEKTNLSIVCKDISQAAEYARIDNTVFSLMKENTPGPFTFLLRCGSSLPRSFKGRKTVGVRIPDSEIARRIVERLGHPVMTSSVEYDEDDYAVNPDLILEKYNNLVELLVDGGMGDIEPSTVVDCTGGGFEIVRQGKGFLE